MNKKLLTNLTQLMKYSLQNYTPDEYDQLPTDRQFYLGYR